MRLSRFSPLLFVTAFLLYCATMPGVGPHGRGLARPALPGALCALAGSVTEAFEALRQRLLASPLGRDTSPDPEQARRDFVALWADLEQGHRP